MSCEECKHFDLHPFIREGDWTCYCDLTGKVADPCDIECENFEEGE